MNLTQIIKHAYGSLALQIYQLTSKRTVMDLSTFFNTPTMTKYHQIVSALRYVAIEEHYGKNNFGKELYIKANHFDDDVAAQKDLNRFQMLISSVETKGYDMRSAIFVDLDGNCFNGTHRLALCVWLGMEKIPVFIVKRHLKQPAVQDMKVIYQLNDESFAQLEQAYQRMYKRVRKE